MAQEQKKIEKHQVTTYEDLIKSGVIDAYDAKVIAMAEECLQPHAEGRPDLGGENFLACVGNVVNIKSAQGFRDQHMRNAVPYMFHAGVIAYLAKPELIGQLNTSVRDGLKGALDAAIKINVEFWEQKEKKDKGGKVDQDIKVSSAHRAAKKLAIATEGRKIFNYKFLEKIVVWKNDIANLETRKPHLV